MRRDKTSGLLVSLAIDAEIFTAPSVEPAQMPLYICGTKASRDRERDSILHRGRVTGERGL